MNKDSCIGGYIIYIYYADHGNYNISYHFSKQWGNLIRREFYFFLITIQSEKMYILLKYWVKILIAIMHALY